MPLKTLFQVIKMIARQTFVKFVRTNCNFTFVRFNAKEWGAQVAFTLSIEERLLDTNVVFYLLVYNIKLSYNRNNELMSEVVLGYEKPSDRT